MEEFCLDAPSPRPYTLRLHAGSDYEITISITVLGHRSVNVGGRTLPVIFGLGFKTYKAEGFGV